MSKEYQLFIAIIKQQLGLQKKVKIPKNLNEKKFLSYIKETTTEGLIFPWPKIQELNLSEEIFLEIKQGYEIIKENKENLNEEYNKLIKSPFEMVFLKDSVFFFNKNYSNFYRHSLDIDILSYFKDLFNLDDYLHKRKYTSYLGKIMFEKGLLDKLVESSNNLIKRQKIKEDINEEYFSIIDSNKKETKESLIDQAANYKSITYYSNKSTIDVHYRLFTKNKQINLKLKKEDLKKIKNKKYILRPETNLVYMAGHYVNHFHLQFGTLKRLIDISEILKEKLDWEYILKRAEESNLNESLWIFLKHGKEILDLPIPQKEFGKLENNCSIAKKILLKKIDPQKLIFNKKSYWEKKYLNIYFNKNTRAHKVANIIHGTYDKYFSKNRKRNKIKKYFSKKYPNIFPDRTPYPAHILIEPTNMCNLQCPLCITGSGASNRKKSFLSFKLLKKVINEVKGKTKIMTISGYGEPFINKEVIKMISYSSKAGIKIYMNTNAHFITSLEMAKKIVGSGINNIKIGLDGIDQKTYEKYRKNGKFEKVIQGIKYLIQAKKELKSKTPKIVLLYLVMKHNEKYRNKAKKLAKNLGANLFHEKPICLSDYQEEEFLKLAKKYFPKDKSMIRYLDLKARGNFGGEIANNCDRLNHTLIINAQGNVVPCVNDHYNKYILGNISKQTIKEIWRGKKFKHFRNQVLKNQKSIDICRNCPASRKKETKHKFTKIK